MTPIEMLLWCPECGERHVDEGEFATKEHHTHACQHCGHVWRPAIVPTCGVQFLPGFKNEPAAEERPTSDASKTNCVTCRHWSPPGDSSLLWKAEHHENYADFGACNLTEVEAGGPNQVELAVAFDDHRYYAILATKPGFGCVQFEGK
jgi:hypothetical protein